MNPGGDSARLLRQFERDGIAACAVMAAAALAIERGRPGGAAGVLAGGALSALSYVAIKRGADAVLDAAASAGRERAAGGAEPTQGGADAGPPAPAMGWGRRAWIAAQFFGRYALLAVGAYVMLACFGVHPVGLLAGATAPFLAAVVYVARSARASSRRRRS